MDVIEKNLNIVFLEMLPERLFQSMIETIQFGKPSPLGADRISSDSFAQYARVHWKDFSDDEHTMLYKSMEDMMRSRPREGYPETKSVFWLLVDCGKRCFVRDNNDLKCRFEAVAHWRSVYRSIGQDMLTTAFLAYDDLRTRRSTRTFAWGAILRTDSAELEQMLQQGIAENHFHLGGSTQSFPLAWCCVMNMPEYAAPLADAMLETNLYAGISLGEADNVMPWKKRLGLAAYLRGLLYQRLRSQGFDTRGEFAGHVHGFSYAAETTRMINRLRYLYGHEFEFPDGIRFCLDYAMQPADAGPFRVLAGERRLMYECFRSVFSGEFNQTESNLFYLYLLLKIHFRREVIQVNRRVGFLNFARYQKRKDFLWRGVLAYQYESTRLALNGALANPAVQSLEARLSPVDTPEKMRDLIWSVDRAKCHADGMMDKAPKRAVPSVPGWNTDCLPGTRRYFFTVHFNKSKDTKKWNDFYPAQRHDLLRRSSQVKARALAAALSKSDYLCQRIRGIDACSNEIGCRPEVFASDFRFLRGTAPACGRYFLENQYMPTLSVTYHAGEDFLDIADGLRAIDEAIHFLNFRRGDRLGHALALGVEPEAYYARKGYKIVQSKQGRLDDLVWCLYRGAELGVVPQQRLYTALTHEAEMLLKELYQAGGGALSLSDYYKSWKLRGDAPERYKSGRYQRPGLFSNPYYDYQTNEDDPELEVYRWDDAISRLYYQYHYNSNVRVLGGKVRIFDITMEYACWMRSLQDEMQKLIAKNGYMIECNPSSNVLIGTFGAYRTHPILRFYHRGLHLPGQGPEPCHQINVSINTDDLGVFDTSLEFEYALLANALLYGLDSNTMQHTFAEVKEYLNQVRQMGMEQIFPPCQRRR